MKFLITFLFLTIIVVGCNKNNVEILIDNGLKKEAFIKELNVHLKICKWKDNYTSAIAFTWDDNNWSVSKCADIFRKYNWRCTFFINPGVYISNNLFNDFKITSEQGFEIGNHSATHARLDTMGISGLKREIIDSKNQLVNQFGYCYSFAYPFHLSSKVSDQLVSDTHLFCRNFLKRDNELFFGANDSANSLESRKNIINKSVESKSWVIFCGHGLDNIGYHPIPSSELDSILLFVKDRNIWVDVFANVCQYYQTYKLAEIGFENNKISIENVEDYLRLLKQFGINSCFLTIQVKSIKKINFKGEGIVSVKEYEKKANDFEYIVNTNLLKDNVFYIVN